MIEFEVKDMAGNECANTIIRVVKETAPTASVQIDLPRHMVRISGVSGTEDIERAIREVGYTPRLQK